MRNSEFEIYNGIEHEILDTIRELIKTKAVKRPTTRADWLRLIRAAIELLPAVPPYVKEGEARVTKKPRGVVYGED